MERGVSHLCGAPRCRRDHVYGTAEGTPLLWILGCVIAFTVANGIAKRIDPNFSADSLGCAGLAWGAVIVFGGGLAIAYGLQWLISR